MIRRLVNLSKTNSFFLFGVRGSGKSTLLKKLFPQNDNSIMWIDLLNLDIELKYKSSPQSLEKEYLANGSKIEWIVIDEVQKVPQILDVVHQLIEDHSVKFALTGSSARKLKRSQANMLAGRAFNFSLFPFSYLELKEKFNLSSALSYGTLPQIFSPQLNDNNDKIRYLKSYISTYLKEEIIVEQLIRKIEPFYRFLEVAAQVNGEILNYSKIAREAKVIDKSVVRYFEILSDTLIGFFLPPYHKSIRKQQIEASRFYFCDTGIVRALRGNLNNEVNAQTYDYGKLFESFIINEIYKLNKYYEKDYKLSYLKTKEGQEIDLIIEAHDKILLIEIKSKEIIHIEDVRPLNNLIDSFDNCEGIVICTNRNPIMLSEKILAIHYKDAIEKIFNT